jgi:hypothetical protein
MRTQFLIAASLCFITLFSSAQLNNPQIRMRIGVARSVVSSGMSDLNSAYRIYDDGSLSLSWIGFEYAKPIWKKRNMNLLLGVFFDEQSYAVGINSNRFSLQPQSSILKSSNSSIRLYTGLEKRIGKKELEKHNDYFSFFGGLGISYNGRMQSSGWSGKNVADGTTTDGKHFEGVYENGPVLTGYFMQVHDRAANSITPDIFAGFRRNIHNQKGNNTLGVELLMNYALMTKFYLDMPYTLDGQPASDRVKNRGTNIQLNLIIPLKNFRKRKEK